MNNPREIYNYNKLISFPPENINYLKSFERVENKNKIIFATAIIKNYYNQLYRSRSFTIKDKIIIYAIE